MKKMPIDIILLYIHVYHKWRSYHICFLKYKVRQTEALIILGHFLPFQPQTTQKIKTLTLKKTPGDNMILYICTINGNHMMYGSFVILDHFLHFYLPKDPENQNFEKMKKTPEDIILQMCTVNDNHIMYGYWDMECNKHNFLSFWTSFCPFTPVKPKKSNFCKNKKKCLEVLSFYTCVP